MDFDGYVLNEEVVLGGFLPYFVNNPINVNLLPIHNFWNAQTKENLKKVHIVPPLLGLENVLYKKIKIPQVRVNWFDQYDSNI